MVLRMVSFGKFRRRRLRLPGLGCWHMHNAFESCSSIVEQFDLNKWKGHCASSGTNQGNNIFVF